MKHVHKMHARRGFLFILLFITYEMSPRSVYRPRDPLMPEITVSWTDSPVSYTLRESHLEEYAFFKLFDRNHFFSHLLPKGPISFRHHETVKVDSSVLTSLIDKLIQEIEQKKPEFSHFKVLQEKNFNRDRVSGLLIVKFKDYPFVVKLFVETPENFVQPFDKGWEPRFLFFMGGGVSRHMTGFTRIKNLELVNNLLQQSPYWSQKVDTPRKWFWVPPSSRWIKIAGKNIGNKPQVTQVPGIYCIIADAIEPKHIFSIFNAQERDIALDLFNYLEMLVDAHINNFMIEKDSNKIVIVDTEHFPTIVGLREKPSRFNSYASWYMYLSRKCFGDMFLRTKKTRRIAQTRHNAMHLVF